MEGRALRSPFFLFQWLPGGARTSARGRSGVYCRVPGCEVRPVILERRKTKELSRLALARFANEAQRATGLRGEVNILLTGDAEIQRLNLQFRSQDKPTDVLSFPAAPAAAPAPAAGSAALPDSAAGGDIAISLAAARAQAAALGHDLLTEVKVLILHGMLHLAGHDHERDHGQMLRLEQKLRGELHLTAGLIERNMASRGATGKPTGKPARKPSGGPAARARRP
jgi:probable rRNA maturation factor